MIDIEKEMAWITFMHDGFNVKWHPVLCTLTGRHLPFDESIMDLCREKFNTKDDWILFGIAPTSQMMIGNSVRSNL